METHVYTLKFFLEVEQKSNKNNYHSETELEVIDKEGKHFVIDFNNYLQMCFEIQRGPTNFMENFVGSWNVVNGGKKKFLLIQLLQTNFGWYNDTRIVYM